MDELAQASGVEIPSTSRALRRLYAIGALRRNDDGGFSAISPWKILTVLAAARDLQADVVAATTLATIEELAASVHFTLGGADAAQHYLGDVAVADRGQRVVYTAAAIDASNFEPGAEVLVVEWGPNAMRSGTESPPFTSMAQTYADLFSLPGWQAAEFLEAMKHFLFSAPMGKTPSKEPPTWRQLIPVRLVAFPRFRPNRERNDVHSKHLRDARRMGTAHRGSRPSHEN
ncbi:hypothetical protein [Cryobacterium sp. GrIS_2_6]|uniref:hypothetical protein n=1 Tax=Cryobacterium sp. GrIS_2_6 TaxID=3162785 RepID=UPI002E0A3E18|nr:hypothetical protein [Cryobacterium psychrotolerans]